MAKYLRINDYIWKFQFTNPTNYVLIDRTGSLCYATTDPVTKNVYVSNDIFGEFLETVVTHEIGHCVIFSYNLLPVIHKMVLPEYWIEAEEWMCNFIADYGRQIYAAVYDILGDMAWLYVPGELERLLA